MPAAAKPAVTDRALRYRANRTPPPGPKRCAFCGNPGRVEVGHVNGHEEDSEQKNLIWTCRSCNVKAGRTLKAAKLGRLTRQYNPGKKSPGAKTLGQWKNAVLSVTPHIYRARKDGEEGTMPVADAVELIRETPDWKRSMFAQEIWAERKRRYGSTGLKSGRRNVGTKTNPTCRKRKPAAKKNPSWRKFKKEARKRLGVVGKKVKSAVKAKKNPARKNPEESATAAYRDFHGKDPSIDIVVDTPVHFHAVLAGMARLVAFDIKRNADGGKTTIKFDRNTYLTESEKRDQIYISGGDQSVKLADFGIRSAHEVEVLGEILSVDYFTEKKHLIEKDGGKGLYRHPFKSPRPMLIYNVRSKLLMVAGGGYKILSEGIDG